MRDRRRAARPIAFPSALARRPPLASGMRRRRAESGRSGGCDQPSGDRSSGTGVDGARRGRSGEPGERARIDAGLAEGRPPFLARRHDAEGRGRFLGRGDDCCGSGGLLGGGAVCARLDGSARVGACGVLRGRGGGRLGGAHGGRGSVRARRSGVRGGRGSGFRDRERGRAGNGRRRGLGERRRDRRCNRGCRRRAGGRRRGSGFRRRRRAGSGDGKRRRRGRRHRSSARYGRRRKRHRRAGREQRERIDVAVRIVGPAHAEVDVRARRRGVLAVADHAHTCALLDDGPARDENRPELEQGHGVPVLGRDRDRPSASGHGPGERDRPADRRPDGGADVPADVDAAVLAAGVRVVAEHERPQHGPVDRPRPRGGARYHEERGEGRREQESAHRSLHLRSLSTVETNRR